MLRGVCDAVLAYSALCRGLVELWTCCFDYLLLLIFFNNMITGLGFGLEDTGFGLGLGLGLEHAVLEPIPATWL